MEKNNILEKKCRKCGIIKNLKEFSMKRSTKDGYQNECKGCNKKYREENKDYFKKYREENKNKIKEKKKEYYENNKKKIKEKRKEYYENNKKKILEREREYYENNKKKIKEYYEENKDRIRIVNREYEKNRILNDPLYKLKKRMRSSIRRSLKDGGYTKYNKTNDILGCSYEELLEHLNDNKYGFIYGADDLDIDHIIPLSRATSEEEIIELNHYSNLQLLPSEYNRHIKRDNDFDNECLEEWLYNS